jgi:hypothetical protein
VSRFGTLVGYHRWVVLIDEDRALVFHRLSIIDVNSPRREGLGVHLGFTLVVVPV